MNVHVPETKAQRRERLSKFRSPVPNFDRKGETIGGGFIVIERTVESKRLRPAAWPHETASYAEAVAARERLKGIHPDREFHIFTDIELVRI